MLQRHIHALVFLREGDPDPKVAIAKHLKNFEPNFTGIPVIDVRPVDTDAVKAKGITAAIIDIDTYDTLMLRLWRNLENRPPDLDAKVRRSRIASVSIPMPPARGTRPLLRLNALPVRSLPTQALVVRTKKAVEWKELKALERGVGRRVIFTKGREVLAWGTDADIAAALGENFVGTVPFDLPAVPDGPDELYIKGFIEEGLVTALARGRPLVPRSTRSGGILIADRNARNWSSLSTVKSKAGGLFGPIPRLMTSATDDFPIPEPLFWAEALRVSLSWRDSSPWLVIDPDIWVWPPRGRELATDFLDGKRRGRFNNRYNDLVSAWIDALFGPRDGAIDLSITLGGADPATFTIGSQTAHAWRQVA